MKAWNWVLALLGGATLGLWAGVAGSAPQEVLTKDGKTYVGEVSEKGPKVIVTPAGGGEAITLNKTDVKERKPFKADTARAEVKKRLAALKADDVNGHMELGNWAAVRGLLPEALGVYQELAVGGNRLAQIEATRIKEMMASAAAPKKDMPKVGEEPGADVKSPVNAAALEDKDIKAVKLREYGDEEAIRFTLVKRDLAKDPKYKDFGSFNADPKELLARAREYAAADPAFLENLTFAPEPATLRKWHKAPPGGRSIQDILVRNCATKACHGGGDMRFQLLAEGTAKENAAYGNFEYVRRYKGGYLLRPKFAETSPILMYGLPAADKKDKVGLDPAVKAHAVVKKMAATDADYKALREWIGELQDVNFTPATAAPATPEAPKPPAP